MGGGDIHIDHQEEGLRRRGCGCSCSKNDFLPEESFQSFGNYLQALKETPMRFKDRLLTRSKDSTEIHEMKARSEHEMKKTLTWWDLIWFGIGAGIFVLTGLEAREHAGPAVVLSYVVSGVPAKAREHTPRMLKTALSLQRMTPCEVQMLKFRNVLSKTCQVINLLTHECF